MLCQVKALVVLNIDLVDSNEAMLVLNKLPNIQVLNGRSTKEEDEEEEREDDEEDDNDNERESNVNKIASCMYSDLEPIEEMQNFESNRNYYSEYNNNNSGVKKKDKEIQDDNDNDNNVNGDIDERKDNDNEEDDNNDNEEEEVNDVESSNNNDNNNNVNKNTNNNISSNNNVNKIPSLNNIPTINNPPLIDITLDELSSLSLLSFPSSSSSSSVSTSSLFTSLLSTIDTLTSQNTLQSFTSSLSHLESQKPSLPNYIYAFNIITLQHSTLKQILTSITPSTPNFQTIYTSLLSSLFSTFSSLSSLFTLLQSKLPAFTSSYTSLQSTLTSLQKSNSHLQSVLTFDKAALEKRIAQLETENTAMTEKVLKHANIITSALDTQSLTTTPPQMMLTTNRKIASTTRSNQHSVYSSNATTHHHVQQGISLTTMKDIVADIYKSKLTYDKKCEEMKLPKETMEQHMYTYLNKKYGLKTLIIDWARNIINGIKTYSRKDSAVLLFGKIMRNEQEEEARFAIEKITSSINDLLLYSLKSKYPFKSVDDINKMFKKKKNEELIEEEWKGIIYYIYEIEQAKELENKVQSFIIKKFTYMKEHIGVGVMSTRNSSVNSSMKEFNNCGGGGNTSISGINSNNSNNNTKMTREEKRNLISIKNNNCILYNDFIKLVLDYHIHLRDKQLRNFIVLFRAVDVDKNGVINENEFATLIRKLNIYDTTVIDDVIYSFLSKIDPFENQKITFSECISLFSTEHVNKTGNALPLSEDANAVITLLEKVCNN